MTKMLDLWTIGFLAYLLAGIYLAYSGSLVSSMTFILLAVFALMFGRRARKQKASENYLLEEIEQRQRELNTAA